MRRLYPSACLTLALLVLCATSASASLNSWSSLPGLTELSGASWVRVYATGSPPMTIYAGTEGDGVFRSLTDGATWEPFSSGLEGEGMSIRAIFTANGKVYAGTDGGLFANGGGSWEPVAQGPEEDPQHPKKLNAAVQAVVSLPGGTMLAGTASFGVYRSTDDGQTWTPPPEGNGMPNDGQTVWSLANFANFVWAATSSGIYRSADFGSTWTLASDGIPESATTLAVFPDGKVPTIYYAATASDGLYRTINGGITWEPVAPEHFEGGTIRAVQEFSGDKETRLYTATQDGLWVATVPNVTLPGPLGSIQVPGQMTWRRVTQEGLASNLIMWALSSFTTTPGTLLAGTQSNGGYALTFQPPIDTEAPSWLAAAIVPLDVGTVLLGTPGIWSGTPEIEYAYQWQRCTSTSSGSCADIEGADERVYGLAPADEGKYIRVEVLATNDFPEPIKALHRAFSAIKGPVEQAPGPLPGEVQQQAPSILDVSPGADPSLPTEGDTLSAPGGKPGESGWYFNPAAEGAISYHWLRCDEEGNNCSRIAGAKEQTYVPAPEDDGLALRVEVAGTNSHGTTTLPLSGPSNPIVPLPATSTSPPTLAGHTYVGSTLVGGVGAWRSPATFYERRWEQCEPDGSACSPVQGETSPGYTVRPDDYGMRLRMAVVADVNPSDRLPLAVEAFTPLSAVISYSPGVTPPPPPPSPITMPVSGLTPPPILTAPILQTLALSSSRVRSGAALKLRYSLSTGGSLSVTIARLSSGHRKGRTCKAGKHTRHAATCTLAKTLGTLATAQLSGAGMIALSTTIHGHKLPPGRYRATIAPVGPGGQRGGPRTVTFTVTRH